MAKYETIKFVEDVQRLASEVLGSDASWLTEDVTVQSGLIVLNDLLPQLPNSWQDNDSLINTGFAFTAKEDIVGLPSSPRCLDLRGVSLNTPRSRFRMFYDYSEYGHAKSQMSKTYRGVESMIAIQQGDWLLFHPQSEVVRYGRISFVAEVPEPDSVGGFILCPRRAYRLALWMTAANAKIADLEPEQAQMLLQRADMEFSRAIQLQDMKEKRDPFVRRAQEQKA